MRPHNKGMGHNKASLFPGPSSSIEVLVTYLGTVSSPKETKQLKENASEKHSKPQNIV